jgi:transcriptional regulator with XRE-family HTH domain
MKAQNKDDFTCSLGKKVASIRKSKGITQTRLADIASLDRMTIALIETGKKNPSMATIYQLSLALKVEPSEFFSGL